MGAPDPRVMSQLRHDVDDVYELVDSTNRMVTVLGTTQRRQILRLEEIQQSLDRQNGVLDLQDSRLGRVERALHEQGGRLDRVEGLLQEQGGRLDRVEGLLHEQGGRLDRVEGLLQEQGGRLDRVDGVLLRMEANQQQILDVLRIPRPDAPPSS